MSEMGKALIAVGALLVVLGAVLLLGGRMNLPIGRLPGDIVYKGKSTTVYFPIVTCIVISVLLTLVLWIVGRFGR
jgi:hypothetical protein